MQCLHMIFVSISSAKKYNTAIKTIKDIKVYFSNESHNEGIS